MPTNVREQEWRSAVSNNVIALTTVDLDLHSLQNCLHERSRTRRLVSNNVTFLNTVDLRHNHTIPGSFCAVTQILPDRVSLFTHKNGCGAKVSVTVRIRADLESGESHIG